MRYNLAMTTQLSVFMLYLRTTHGIYIIFCMYMCTEYWGDYHTLADRYELRYDREIKYIYFRGVGKESNIDEDPPPNCCHHHWNLGVVVNLLGAALESWGWSQSPSLKVQRWWWWVLILVLKMVIRWWWCWRFDGDKMMIVLKIWWWWNHLIVSFYV